MQDVVLLQPHRCLMDVDRPKVDAPLGLVNTCTTCRALLAPALGDRRSLLSSVAANLRVTEPLLIDAIGNGHKPTIRALSKAPRKLLFAS